ncbi:MAG: MotA/TolQ/ExbB proton channel family protein [Verrucomicrobiota bacterium]
MMNSLKMRASLTATLMPIVAFAQTGENASQKVELNTFRDVLAAGGWPMDVLILLSILAIALVVFFLLSLRSPVLHPRAFMRQAENAAMEGDVEALQSICERSSCAAARVLKAACEHMLPDMGGDYAIVRDAIEDEGARQAGVLWQRIQYLMDIAVIAPMVGLLGTVLGMLDSFAGMNMEVGGVNPISLSGGISKALVTTAGGLVVGIAAMVLYSLFRGRVNRLVSGLETATNEVLRLYIRNRNSTSAGEVS